MSPSARRRPSRRVAHSAPRISAGALPLFMPASAPPFDVTRAPGSAAAAVRELRLLAPTSAAPARCAPSVRVLRQRGASCNGCACNVATASGSGGSRTGASSPGQFRTEAGIASHGPSVSSCASADLGIEQGASGCGGGVVGAAAGGVVAGGVIATAAGGVDGRGGSIGTHGGGDICAAAGGVVVGGGGGGVLSIFGAASAIVALRGGVHTGKGLGGPPVGT